MLWRRFLAAALAALTALPLLASCAGEKTPAGDEGGTSTPVSYETETTTDGGRAAVKDNLPDDLTLGGRTVTLFSYSSGVVDTGPEEETGDSLNDAVFRRNLAVAERLDVDLNILFSEVTRWQDYASELRRSRRSPSTARPCAT